MNTMTAPNGMKTYQQQTTERIERGQDINNTWALVAAYKIPVVDEVEMQRRFDELFPIVQAISARARSQ